jgi:hypothetical protein
MNAPRRSPGMNRVSFVVLVFLAPSWNAALASAQPVPNPTLSGPVTGGSRGAFGALTAAALKEADYLEREYFFAGTARSFDKADVWTTSGVWNVVPADSAEFRVRMLVRRPAGPPRFNGVVVVEWLNVTAMSEGAADFLHMQEEILREGYVWVGIGAQAAGVHSPTGLKAWDSARYGSLIHPGDRFSFDIFSQAAQAILHPRGIDPVGLPARRVIATGRSQSAFRLITYINAIHPLANLYQGFLVHSRGAGAAGLRAEGLAPDASPAIPPGAHIRSDTKVPVLDVQAEGDMTALRSHLTRQPPNPNYRRWEIAGAAHAETPRWVVEVPPPLDAGPGCAFPVNAAPHHAVMKAALRGLTRWVNGGAAPPQSPDIELTDPTAVPAAIVRDAFGNAKGGIRLPQVEVPTATLDGRINSPAKPPASGTQNFCSLFGATVPFSPERLKELYPTHERFVSRFGTSTKALVQQGYWLEPEAEQARRAADASSIGK